MTICVSNDRGCMWWSELVLKKTWGNAEKPWKQNNAVFWADKPLINKETSGCCYGYFPLKSSTSHDSHLIVPTLNSRGMRHVANWTHPFEPKGLAIILILMIFNSIASCVAVFIRWVLICILIRTISTTIPSCSYVFIYGWIGRVSWTCMSIHL